MAGTGIAGPQYRGGQGYQFRLTGRSFARRFPEGTEGVVDVREDLQIVSSLLHRRAYFGIALGSLDTDATTLLYLNGKITFTREDRNVGEIPICWGNDATAIGGSGGRAFEPQASLAWAAEELPQGLDTFPPHPLAPAGRDVLIVALPSLRVPPDTLGRNPKAILRLWPYQVTVEADRAEIELQYAINFTSGVPRDLEARGWWGIYSQDHPF